MVNIIQKRKGKHKVNWGILSVANGKFYPFAGTNPDKLESTALNDLEKVGYAGFPIIPGYSTLIETHKVIGQAFSTQEDDEVTRYLKE